MATKKIVKDVPAMLNAFADSLRGTEWDGYLPTVTDGITQYGDVVLQYPEIMNRFLTNLVNVVAFSAVSHMYFNNPLSFVKQGYVPHGFTIEQIWVNLCKPHKYYDKPDDMTSFADTETPDVVIMYFPRNREDYFKQTIWLEDLRSAFYTGGGMERLVNTIIDNMYGSNDYTEFANTLGVLANALNRNMISLIQVQPVTDEATAKALLTAMREYTINFRFPKTAYNALGVLNTTATRDLRVWLTPKAASVITVEVLAYTFNIEKADMLGKVTEIPEIPGHPEILSVMSDDMSVQEFDNLFRPETWWNPEKLYMNYWLHVWQFYLFSPQHNCVAFTTGEIPTVESVELTANPTSYTPGSFIQLSVNVTGENGVSNDGRWELKGKTSQATKLMNNNTISVGLGETGELEVTFFPFADQSKATTITISKG